MPADPHRLPGREQPHVFSHGNKLSYRATPTQAAWLAEHIAATGVRISAVMRAAIDLYIQTNNQPTQ